MGTWVFGEQQHAVHQGLGTQDRCGVDRSAGGLQDQSRVQTQLGSQERVDLGPRGLPGGLHKEVPRAAGHAVNLDPNAHRVRLARFRLAVIRGSTGGGFRTAQMPVGCA